MGNMKYIIVEDHTGNYAPYIFPAWVKHADFARKLSYMALISAGFVKIVDGKISTYGGSVSLNVKSSKKDEEIISKFF